MLRKISLGSIGLFIGGTLAVVGMIAYTTGNSTLSLAGLFYGVPILLGGAALKSSEVKPVPVIQTPSEAVIKLRNEQATSTQNKLRLDVTRYRYGVEAHLDEVLKKLGMSPTDEERPVLSAIYEEITEQGYYSLILQFASPLIPPETWEQKQEKLTRFFGPGIVAEIVPLDNKEIALKLITVPTSPN
ncbi:Protein of unknown function (DUF2854) [Synechococcus sp. PCC 7502]|uniref:DUF2854 domain-containing protein n=1 Tax=Synechococcus sp. PCC 7502 TaxID=1173263 RepID=UPI00029FC635|nr:DUF2854 domain-containing protein [Synechococcus sp. PCC 7502]AFY75319.1 Protein of unknown function (DUF2854) [Synechococcus sp. PCC 7502]